MGRLYHQQRQLLFVGMCDSKHLSIFLEQKLNEFLLLTQSNYFIDWLESLIEKTSTNIFWQKWQLLFVSMCDSKHLSIFLEQKLNEFLLSTQSNYFIDWLESLIEKTSTNIIWQKWQLLFVSMCDSKHLSIILEQKLNEFHLSALSNYCIDWLESFIEKTSTNIIWQKRQLLFLGMCDSKHLSIFLVQKLNELLLSTLSNYCIDWLESLIEKNLHQYQSKPDSIRSQYYKTVLVVI